MPSMQSISNVSKFLITAVLSSIFFLAWYGDNTKIVELRSSHTQESSSVSPAQSVDFIWDSMSSGFKLDHKLHLARVQAEIRKLLADKAKLYEILEAAGPYIYFIHKQTQARGLPAEIALIAFIESEFNPNDRSHKGATGLWQLMPGTANELGVKVKSNYDGRRNVIVSTKAALAYFKDLSRMFNGHWYLAIDLGGHTGRLSASVSVI